MEEFGKKEILNPFLKWFGRLLICPIAILIAVCGDWIWAVESAGMGIIIVLFGISRVSESRNLMACLLRCLTTVFAILSIMILSIDIFMWHRAFLALAIAVGLLVLSFRNKR